MHLYELTDQMRGLQDLIEEGEMDQVTLADTLEGLEGDIQSKGRGTLAVMANLGSDIAAFDHEIKRMQARKKTVENNFTWLKEYLRTNMLKSGITKIESDVFTASLGKPGKVVEILDESLVPAIMLKYTPATYTPIKADIARALKAGQDVPGCKLTDAKAPLRIK